MKENHNEEGRRVVSVTCQCFLLCLLCLSKQRDLVSRTHLEESSGASTDSIISAIKRIEYGLLD